MILIQAGENRGLYKRLGISLEKPYIFSPTRPESKIFTIFDIVHGFKNWFSSMMDNVCLNPDTGNSWSKRDFQDLLEETDAEVSPTFK